jgi:hypothetical protein
MQMMKLHSLAQSMRIKKFLQPLFYQLKTFFGQDKVCYQVAPYFDKLFIEDQYYLSPKASLADFCNQAHIPEDVLNNYLQLKYKLGFEDLCDVYVVKKIIDIRRNPDIETPPVHIMAEAKESSQA